MDSFLTTLQNNFGENRVRVNEQMSMHTLLKVGGPASYYIELDKTDDLIKAIRLAHSLKQPFLVIGSGSKTIFSDSGFLVLVIKNNTRKFDVLSRKGKIRNNKIDVDRAYIYADSGAILNQVVRFSLEQGYSGLEEMLGVLGTTAGSLYDSNYVLKLTDVLHQIQAISFDGNVRQVTTHDLLYPDSRGAMHKGKYIVLSVIFELFPGHSGTLWEKGTKNIEKRSRMRPESPFAYPAFCDITQAEAMSIPTPGYARSVDYLITKVGFAGKRVGDAVLSEHVPNFIINLGNATGNDMIGLLEQTAEIVKEKFGVTLRPLFTLII